MLEQTFFCIRPYAFEKRGFIKKMITDAGSKIKNLKILWLTPNDLSVLYGHEEPSVYFDACTNFMTNGFVEAGVIEGKNAIEKLINLVGNTHIPNESKSNTIRAIFGKTDPINFNGLDYYLNPLHRSKTKAEAKREVALFNDQLVGRTSTQILSDMLLKLHQDKGLECVFNHHIKLVVEKGIELAKEFEGDKEIVELACWLHDIASLTSSNKHNHHIEGAKKAKKILLYLGYDYGIIKNVMHCIETHRGSYPLIKMTKEAEIVCSADGIANLSYPLLLCYYAYGRKQLNFEDGTKKSKKKD